MRKLDAESSATAFKSFNRKKLNLGQKIAATIAEDENSIKQLFHSRLLDMRR